MAYPVLNGDVGLLVLKSQPLQVGKVGNPDIKSSCPDFLYAEFLPLT